MNNIVKYNTILLKYIVLFSLIVVLCFTTIRFYNYHKKNKNKEQFSQVSLEKQVAFYDDYRNYIEGKDYLTSRFRRGRKIPYTVSPRCFTRQHQQCVNDQTSHRLQEPLVCQDKSYDQCYVEDCL